MWMKVKRLHPDAIMPERAHKGDAGMDVFALENVVIESGCDHLFPLGWACAIPEGWALIVKEKSGRAVKDKLDVGACLIDSSYRGEVHVHLFSNKPSFLSQSSPKNKPVYIKKGEKIAQMILVPIWTGTPEEVDDLDETDRGDGGFGSTGLEEKPKPMSLIVGYTT